MDSEKFESFVNFLQLQAWAQSKFICQNDAFHAEKEAIPLATQTHFRSFLRGQDVNPSDGAGIGESVKYMPLYSAFGVHERYLLEKVYRTIDDPRTQVQAMFAFTVNRRCNVFDVLLPYLESFGTKCFSPNNDTGAFHQVYNALRNLQSNGHSLGTEKGTYLHVPRYNEEERIHVNAVNVNYASGREALRDIAFDKIGHIHAVSRDGPARRCGITNRWLLACAHPHAAKRGAPAVPSTQQQGPDGQPGVALSVAENSGRSVGDGTRGDAAKHFVAFCKARENLPVTVCLKEKGNFTRWLMRRMAEFSELGGEVYDLLMARPSVKVMEICRFIAEINKRRMLNVGGCMEKIFVVSLHLRFPERKLLASECQVGSTNPSRALRLLFPKLRGLSAKDACAKTLRDHLMPRLRENEKLKYVTRIARATALQYATTNEMTCLYNAIASMSSTHLEAGDIQVNLCEWLKYLRDHVAEGSANKSIKRVKRTFSPDVPPSSFRPRPKCRQTIFRVGIRPVRRNTRATLQRSARPCISLLDDDQPVQQPRILLSARQKMLTSRQSELSRKPSVAVPSGPAVASTDSGVALARVVHDLDSSPMRTSTPRLILDLDSPTPVTAPPLSVRNLNLTLRRAVAQLSSISNTAMNTLGRDTEVLLRHIMHYEMSFDKYAPATPPQAHATVCRDERIDDGLVMQLHASLHARVRSPTKGVEELIANELCALLRAYLARQNARFSGDCVERACEEKQNCDDDETGLSESLSKSTEKRSYEAKATDLSTDPLTKRGKVVGDKAGGSSDDPPRKRQKNTLGDTTLVERSIMGGVAMHRQLTEATLPPSSPADSAPDEQNTTGRRDATKMPGRNDDGFVSSASKTASESASAVSLVRRKPCRQSCVADDRPDKDDGKNAPVMADTSRSLDQVLPHAGRRIICLFADTDSVESRSGTLECSTASSPSSPASVSHGVSSAPALSIAPAPFAAAGPLPSTVPAMDATPKVHTSTLHISAMRSQSPGPYEKLQHISSPLNARSARHETDEPSRTFLYRDDDGRHPCFSDENTLCGRLETRAHPSFVTALSSFSQPTDPTAPSITLPAMEEEPRCRTPPSMPTKNSTNEITRPRASLIELLSPPTSPTDFFFEPTPPSEYLSLPASPIELFSPPVSPIESFPSPVSLIELLSPPASPRPPCM